MKLINDDRCKKNFRLNICSILYIFYFDFFLIIFFSSFLILPCVSGLHLSLIVMDDEGVVRHGSALNKTSLRNIVLKSSLTRVQGARLNFAHLNPGSAVPHIGELNDLFNGVDLQMIAVSETWYKTKHTNRQVNLKGYRVIRADRGRGRRGGGVALYLREGTYLSN
jgi:hypothetical protein